MNYPSITLQAALIMRAVVSQQSEPKRQKKVSGEDRVALGKQNTEAVAALLAKENREMTSTEVGDACGFTRETARNRLVALMAEDPPRAQMVGRKYRAVVRG
jgi:response regulator of citrate/malate metabolism